MNWGILPLLTRQHACQWEKKVGCMRHELRVDIEHPEEAAELLECFGHRKVFNLKDFRWGRSDAVIIKDVAQEFYLRYAESTFFGLEDHAEISQFEQYVELLFVLVCIFGSNEDIVQICKRESETTEHLVNKTLKGLGGVSETERHACEFE